MASETNTANPVLVDRWLEEAKRWQRQRLTGELSLSFQQGTPVVLKKHETEKSETHGS